MNISIGEFIKELRKKHNMTLEFLQEKSGVSNSHISRIERGLRDPSPDTLKRLSDPLNILYEKLLEVAGYLDKNSENTKNTISDDPELADFWGKLKEREDLKLLFKQTKDMPPEGVRQIIRIIKAIEDE